MAQDVAIEKPPSQPYPRTGWIATTSLSAAGLSPADAIDGNAATRWATGQHQMGNESFSLDLGASRLVSQVVLDASGFPTDFPAMYVLEVSTALPNYRAVAMAAGAAVTRIQFSQVMARYIRIRQTATTPVFLLFLHSPLPPPTPTPSAPLPFAPNPCFYTVHFDSYL